MNNVLLATAGTYDGLLGSVSFAEATGAVLGIVGSIIALLVINRVASIIIRAAGRPNKIDL